MQNQKMPGSTVHLADRVVVIGASAGGFTALEQFFRQLPETAELACIVLLHLEPNHKSELCQIVSKWSPMTVVEAADGLILENGCVYISPPGALVSVRKGILQVKRGKNLGHHLIDFLFHSVATDQAERAVGVIMSGLLNDGASGLAAIRNNGGLGLVQEPSTAEFDSMPRAAIEEGGADKVLAPDKMPQFIVDYCAAPKRIPNDEAIVDDIKNKILDEILDLLSHCGAKSYHGYKKTTLLRRIKRRMSLCLVDDLNDYLGKLRQDPTELKQLATDLMIGVTAFYRDPEAFSILESHVVPDVFEQKQQGGAIRIWVAGCSTGQEAYSVALQMYEYRRESSLSNAIIIFATDINESALEVARRGCFSRDAVLSSVPGHLIERYFIADSQGFTISKEIRDMVVFAPHNLLCDPPFSRLDLIVCRNVFIYMEPETQNKLLSVFRYALNGSGYLFLGGAETIGFSGKNFETISKQWRIFRCINKQGNKHADMPMATVFPGYKPHYVDDSLKLPASIRNERHYRKLMERNGPALVLVNCQQEVFFTGGNVSKFLSLPHGELSNDLNLLLKPELLSRVRSIMSKVKSTNSQLAVVGHCRSSGLSVRVTARVLENDDHGALYLLTFDEEAEETQTSLPALDRKNPLVEELEYELQVARDDLFYTIEQLRFSNEEQKAVNEEIMAMNEELQSANEVLENSKEELQSLNEELLISNNQLDANIGELAEVNNDLNNLFKSTDIAVIFLDRTLRIKRFTEATTRVMHLIPSYVDRPVIDIAHKFVSNDLAKLADEVLRTQAALETEVQDSDDRTYIQRILPYRTEKDEIKGVVITFTDITLLKNAHRKIETYAEQLQNQAQLLNLDYIHLLARDLDDRVIFWNKGSEQLYGWSAEEAIGKVSHDLLRTEFPVPLEEIQAVVTETGDWIGELIHYTRNGKPITVVSHWELTRDSQGQAKAIVEVNNDITIRKALEHQIQESEGRFRQLAEALPQIVWLADKGAPTTDEASHRMLYANQSFERVWGYSPQMLYDEPELRFKSIHPDDRERVRSMFTKNCDNGPGICEYRIVRADGTIRHIKDQWQPIKDAQQNVYRFAGIAQDITEQKQSEERLHQSAVVFESTNDGIIITDHANRIQAVNQAFTIITGYAQEEVIGRNPRFLQSGRHSRDYYEVIWHSIVDTGSWQGEIWNRRKNGEVYPEWLTINTILDPEGTVINYVAVFSDISRIKTSELKLEKLSHYDPLTQLPNRSLLMNRLEHALEQSKRHQFKGGVLFLDLDRFKNVNDSFGHPIGDELLIDISGRLLQRLRADDTLARLGGDEFIILLEKITNPQSISLVAKDLLACLKEPFILTNGREVYISASIGITVFPDDGMTTAQLIQNADTATFKAKENGRNTYHFYTQELTQLAHLRLSMESQLRRGLERDEFVLYYQPLVDMVSHRIVGCEALIRWRPEGKTLVSPADFIPLAEETGLMIPMGAWVLRKACQQAMQWFQDGMKPITLAVNLSSIQFRQADLIDMVRDILHESNFPPEYLELEITETALMDKSDEAEATLVELKKLGVKLSIDDFGTGYSSLAYLKRFPIDKLKIDRTFISDIPQDHNDAVIAKTIIDMSHNLGLKVLGEGVETDDQLGFLSIELCDYYQGYFFSPPVPAEEFFDLCLQTNQPEPAR
ncbi:MAG: EAL domain-containing protein [Gammaproteobacteria bacterium]